MTVQYRWDGHSFFEDKAFDVFLLSSFSVCVFCKVGMLEKIADDFWLILAL